MSSALRTRRYAGSNPARKANRQRVGESGRPYLPWKQGIVCSNHTTLTIVIDPWRNRNAAVCKTVMSRGSTGRVIQDKQTDGLRKEITELFHGLVDRLDGQRISTPPFAGSNPVSGMTAGFERAYEGSIPSSATNRSASRGGVAAHNGKQDGSKPLRATIYFRPRLSARTLACGAGKHGAAPWVGTSFRSEAQVDERGSPKPEAPGSRPGSPAIFSLMGAEKPLHLIAARRIWGYFGNKESGSLRRPHVAGCLK